MLSALLPAQVFAPLLVFAQLGSAMMLLPGFGELYVPQRYRLLLALVLAVLVTPALLPGLPALAASPGQLATVLFAEIVIGVFLGSLARVLLLALETAGNYRRRLHDRKRQAHRGRSCAQPPRDRHFLIPTCDGVGRLSYF